MEQRLRALGLLQTYLKERRDEMQEVIQRAYAVNAWFIPEFIHQSLDHIADTYLNQTALREWADKYRLVEKVKNKKVGLIMAGNLPLVGFHDWLSVFVSGHDSLVKLSSKDEVLMKYLMDVFYSFGVRGLPQTTFVDQLKGYDAVIATGTDNSALHFKYYFRKVPHLIRQNRTGIAILDGTESEDQLLSLGHDLFDYFGLGCRNISKLFVPSGYDFSVLQEVLDSNFPMTTQHHKYRNNYDYNLAIYLINSIGHTAFNSIILTEDNRLYSRIATLHYEYYEHIEEVEHFIQQNKDALQCVISNRKHSKFASVAPGKGQYPNLMDYADGVDTMSFLKGL